MKTLLTAIISFALLGAPVYAQTAQAPQTTAQTSTEAQLQALQAQLDALKAQIEAIKAQQVQQQQAPVVAASAPPEQYLRMKPNSKTMTFLVGKKDEFTVYGHLDVSVDDVTKGLHDFYPAVGAGPLGNHSWMDDIASNSTYFGVRGSHKLGGDNSLVYQVETGIAFTASAGTVNSNSTSDSVVNGALTTRPTYIGLQTDAGRFLVGKTYTPYRNSTARMNPFSGQIGDYSVVMGNTGGDNRVEFGYVLDHAIWYESPNMGGFKASLLASPGQNRSSDDSEIASGESDCTGQQSPGAGALPPFCNDGAYGSGYSGDLEFSHGPLYLTTAYEIHKKVNRSSDLANLDPNDVADEDAFKAGLQYAFSRATTFSAVYEDFHRYVPQYLEYQNERTRIGFWFALTQWLDAQSNINFGWARANPTPGDPGQHNTPATANPDNMANMFTAAYKRNIDEHFGWYVAYADTVNHSAAHYDLGAGGHGVTTDCHDASIEAAFDATANPPISGNGPHCWAGGHLQGISIGLTVNF
jgi:predicted porin